MTRTRVHARGNNVHPPSLTIVASAVAAVAFVGGSAAAIVAIHHSNGRPAGADAPAQPGSHGPGSNPGTGSGHPQTPIAPLLVASITPAPGATNVTFQPTITVNLSQPIAPGSARPVLTPQVPGSWTQPTPTSFVFRATAQLTPFSTVHVSIPGGSTGVRDTQGTALASTVDSSFTVAAASTTRLQQLLAELGYLPVTFVRHGAATLTSTSGPAALAAHGQAMSAMSAMGAAHPAHTGPAAAPPPQAAIGVEPTAADQVPLAPLPGHFAWRFPNTPTSLRKLWVTGQPNVILRGAVMAFESAHGLATDGAAGPLVWHALLQDVAARRFDSNPYNYITVSETLPQSLSVWQNGHALFSVLANTGISVAPTAKGTFPVYVRYLVTTMSGKNPDGTTYHDPGIPWVAYFNGGDAIHGFIRPGYGYPQSLGCVELTFGDAKTVYAYDQLGTLVTVN